MKITLTSFRGEVPRMTPRALPENAAQEATNCRMQTGDLESWRQFLLTKVLANSGPVQTIYKLNGAWLSWNAPVDVARGLIAGDNTFRAYLTSPGLYAQPRFTNYALATTGAEPYPVTTRPLGVPGPVGDAFKPVLTAGIDPNPLTFTVPEVVDTCDDLGTGWIVSPQAMGDGNTSLVRQSTVEGHPAGCFELVAQNNGGNPAYALKDFGIKGTSLATFSVDAQLYELGGNDGGFSTVMFGVGKSGGGCRIMFGGAEGSDLKLFINNGPDLLSGDGGMLAQAVCTGAMTLGTWYTITAVKTVNPDNSVTVVAKLLVGAVEVGTVTATNLFDDGGYCGIIRAKGDDVLGLRFDNFRVAGSGSTGYVAVNTAVSYVYTFVNDLGEESPPSPVSDTALRPDGISMTVTMPTTLPVYDPPTQPVDYSLYGIVGKRLYRAVTGASGTVFLLLVEIPLAQADYVDILDDSQIAGNDVLESDEWDLPPDGLQGIIALPNGIMAGFWRNLLCLSEIGRPHAWPVRYRLPTDTDIVAISNIDNTIVVGTKSFPYTATGNSPGGYSMSKPGDPQACTSKRSMVFMPDQGVVYASPDGMMVCAGSAGQIKNATSSIFTKRQWQALNPASMVCAVHDGVLFFFVTGAGYALDTAADGFGLIRLSFHAIALHVDPLTDALYLVLDVNSEPTDADLPLASTAVVTSNKTIYEFDAGASNMVFRWRGRLNLSPYPLALTIAQVRALNYTNLLVRVYADGVLVFEKVLANAREFVLPLLDTHGSYELELLGTSTVRTMQAAEDVMELG